MAIPNLVAAGKGKWMEITPSQKERVVKRRPYSKKLLTIAEERSLSNGELMDGLYSVFPVVSDIQAKGDNGRFASAECWSFSVHLRKSFQGFANQRVVYEDRYTIWMVHLLQSYASVIARICIIFAIPKIHLKIYRIIFSSAHGLLRLLSENFAVNMFENGIRWEMYVMEWENEEMTVYEQEAWVV